MSWTCPVIIEICVGMEITSYEFRRDLDSANKSGAARLGPVSSEHCGLAVCQTVRPRP